MADLNMNKDKKIIAFYLPQYHTIPENDKWWGKGFTEWTNTKKAKPLFEWHYQPRIPLHENYYNLSDVAVMERQATMAKKYGIYGFCYYHYWFKDGKKLLEKPIENMLADSKVDIPFCLCWANENWTRNWDGGNKEVIAEQDYGNCSDWEMHFKYLLSYFKDNRYIKDDGKPLLFIYKPEQIDSFNDMIDYWKKRAKEEGLVGLSIICQFPRLFYSNEQAEKEFDKSRIDYFAKFEPVANQTYEHFGYTYSAFGKIRIKARRVTLSVLNKLRDILVPNYETNLPKVCDYDAAWKIILNDEPCGKNIINGGFVDWDNTARNVRGLLYKGATPQKFEEYMTELLRKQSALGIVVLNAWNEWAEGAYLEPDVKYEYQYLESLKRAIDANQ